MKSFLWYCSISYIVSSRKLNLLLNANNLGIFRAVKLDSNIGRPKSRAMYLFMWQMRNVIEARIVLPISTGKSCKESQH